MIGLQIQSWYVGMLTSEASRHVSICESHISMTDLSWENNLFWEPKKTAWKDFETK